MKNDWRFYTTHEGISSVRNQELDEKNYYRMKIFMKNYFKDRFTDHVKKPTSLIFSIVMNLSGNDHEQEETAFLCNVNIDRQRIALSWTDATGVCITAGSREGNVVIRELYSVLKESADNDFTKIYV